MPTKQKQSWRTKIGKLITEWKYKAGDDVLAEALADEVIWHIEKLLLVQLQKIRERVEDFNGTLNSYDVSSDAIDDDNTMLKGLIKDTRNFLQTLSYMEKEMKI